MIYIQGVSYQPSTMYTVLFLTEDRNSAIYIVGGRYEIPCYIKVSRDACVHPEFTCKCPNATFVLI